jgi:hypothetical protein
LGLRLGEHPRVGPRNGLYAVWLAHGTGASGPSNILTIWPRYTVDGSRARRYLPPFPFRLQRIPWFLRTSRIASRNPSQI